MRKIPMLGIRARQKESSHGSPDTDAKGKREWLKSTFDAVTTWLENAHGAHVRELPPQIRVVNVTEKIERMLASKFEPRGKKTAWNRVRDFWQ